jgi:hypothetical protein
MTEKECKVITAAEYLVNKLHTASDRAEKIRYVANFIFEAPWKGCKCGCQK